jgi:hypothetical protein
VDREKLISWLFIAMAVLVVGYAAFAAYFTSGRRPKDLYDAKSTPPLVS